MQDQDRQELTQRLGRLMLQTSQLCFASGWHEGTEYELPELCRRAIESGYNQPWGQGRVTVDLARELQTLADSLGHWANRDSERRVYMAFSPFPIPKEVITKLDNMSARASWYFEP